MPPERLNQRGRRRSRDLLGALVVFLVLAACQPPTSSPTSAPMASGAPSASAAAAECPEIRLRTPQGDALDLTGTWTTGSVEGGNQVVYQLRQAGECLWGRAYSAYAGQEQAESFDIILVGTVHSDFTVELDLLELRLSLGDPIHFPSFGRAAATLRIEFEAASDEPTLAITALQARRIAADVPSGWLFPGSGPVVGQVLTRSP